MNNEIIQKFTNNFKKYITSNKLTNLQLQHISKKCGITLNTPVKKENIIRDIHACLVESYVSRESLIQKKMGAGIGSKATQIKEPLRVFSIDTGLRNFSFCRFEIDNFDSLNGKSVTKRTRTMKKVSAAGIPKIIQWFKMDLNMWSGNPNSDFTPLNYSSMINDLVFDLIYKNGIETPDIILIERQRFRTMGNHNVFEHILKANVLENMLVSSLSTANCINPDVYNAQIQSVSPQVMSSFWSNYVHENELDGWFKPSVLSDKNTKDLRIELVDNWMNQLINPEMSPQFPNEVTFGDHLRTQIELDQAQQNHLSAKNSKRQNFGSFSTSLNSSSSKRLFCMMNYLNDLNLENLKINLNPLGKEAIMGKPTEVAKGDDLADSLLHGLSWWKFQQNRIKFFNYILDYSSQDLEKKSNIDFLLKQDIGLQMSGLRL